MTEITLSVPDIHCNHCKASIEWAAGALPGVRRAEVDVASARVTVAFEEPATLDQIVTAIEAEGYPVPAQS